MRVSTPALTMRRDDTAHDGVLEAEPRLLKQTRNFLLHQRAPAEQTFQGSPMRRCDARTAHGNTGDSRRAKSQNLPSPIPFQTHWYRKSWKPAARLGRM
jgi:hypothetical protein